jgi:hypothetical protein
VCAGAALAFGAVAAAAAGDGVAMRAGGGGGEAVAAVGESTPAEPVAESQGICEHAVVRAHAATRENVFIFSFINWLSESIHKTQEQRYYPRIPSRSSK